MCSPGNSYTGALQRALASAAVSLGLAGALRGLEVGCSTQLTQLRRSNLLTASPVLTPKPFPGQPTQSGGSLQKKKKARSFVYEVIELRDVLVSRGAHC